MGGLQACRTVCRVVCDRPAPWLRRGAARRWRWRGSPSPPWPPSLRPAGRTAGWRVSRAARLGRRQRAPQQLGGGEAGMPVRRARWEGPQLPEGPPRLAGSAHSRGVLCAVLLQCNGHAAVATHALGTFVAAASAQWCALPLPTGCHIHAARREGGPPDAKTGRPRCMLPPFLGLTPPTT